MLQVSRHFSQRLRAYLPVTFSEGFESFLSTKFPSAKRFGLEGGETLIPGLFLRAFVQVFGDKFETCEVTCCDCRNEGDD